MTTRRDNNTGVGSSRSKEASSSPAGSCKSNYQLAPVVCKGYFRTSGSSVNNSTISVADASEGIRLKPYDSQAEKKQHMNIEETSCNFDERPPVEGEDSLTNVNFDNMDNKKQQRMNNDLASATYVPPSKPIIAGVRDLRSAKPKVEPFPLVQNRDRFNADSPESLDLSPYNKTQLLFADEMIESPTSDVIANDANVDFEYDDYILHLPGSYFTMDPMAYTLTWSKQPTSSTQTAVTDSETLTVEQSNKASMIHNS